ncbi:hypothetical protein AI27_06475 [Sphingomonas sp. BHC-A]|uniref:Bacteriophage T5 Orf172 DNA-binding domain-containing protein n=1 Tax=Sphingobium indicum (strain DSM 16412 / CCM 7286 / MTCC 6364 / B90A) TaxID=861109 RepID=A0A1L5BMI8_SPHIB|nr:GIY-YIG nuclease family protein [Sphingobium indicum]APL94105.1 hypothetical protein SIDU_06065 [Sphingobium indicum B90A]KEZ00309.1 hypothetical protein AI27_06475 [Sphingomonas sp. BHC-A]
MSVYFLQHGASGPVKVGYSKRPEKRIATIATSCPDPIVVLAVIDGSHALEQRIHRAFRAHRYRGEWLRPTDEVISFVTLCASASSAEIERRLADMEGAARENLADLDASGQAFAAIFRLGVCAYVKKHGAGTLSHHSGIARRRIRAIIDGAEASITELAAFANAAPEIVHAAAIAVRDNLPELEAARDTLDELIRRRVQRA